MLSSMVVALGMAMSPGQCATCPTGGGMAFSPGMSSGSWVAGAGGGYNPYDSVAAGGGGGGDQLYPFDSPEPWLHGHFQELPAYSGYSSFRPHNYKHVLAQMQVASRWGIPATMPYSHQWYHRYRQRAGMHPSWDTRLSATGPAPAQNYAASPAPSQVMQTSAQPQSRPVDPAAFIRGYVDTPIPGISTPTYQRSIETYRQMQMPSRQYQERFEALQNQLEQQTFRLQAMQQQLEQQQQQRMTFQRAHEQYNAQPWAQPNHLQFQQNPSAQPMQAPGTFIPPQSAVPAQPNYSQPSMSYPQPAQVYASAPYGYDQAPAAFPGASAQPATPQMAPNPMYSAQPMTQPGMMSSPQRIPQSSMMMQNTRMAPAQPVFPQQSYPQAGYPQNWSGSITPTGQAFPGMSSYPQNSQPSAYGQGYAPATPMYQAQPIPTMMSAPYGGQ